MKGTMSLLSDDIKMSLTVLEDCVASLGKAGDNLETTAVIPEKNTDQVRRVESNGISRATDDREKKPLIWAELSIRLADGRTSGATRSQVSLHLLMDGSFEPCKGFQVVSRQLACGIPCKKVEGAAFEVVAKREVKAIIYRARALDP